MRKQHAARTLRAEKAESRKQQYYTHLLYTPALYCLMPTAGLRTQDEPKSGGLGNQ